MTESATHPDHPDSQHGGVGQYLVVFACLCLLTGASFFTYSSYWPFHDRPHIGWAFMMAISCTKALLVILFFMHLLWEANWKYVLTVPATLASTFLVLMLVPDVGWRLDNGFARYSRERLLHSAIPAGPHRYEHDAAEDHQDGGAAAPVDPNSPHTERRSDAPK